MKSYEYRPTVMSFGRVEFENMADALEYYITHRLPGYKAFEKTYDKLIYTINYDL